MIKCKWCGVAEAAQKSGYCSACESSIRADILKHKNVLSELSNKSNPLLSQDEKSAILNEASASYNRLIQYKARNVPFFTSDILQMKNSVLKNLGMPQEQGVKAANSSLVIALIGVAVIMVSLFVLSQLLFQQKQKSPLENLQQDLSIVAEAAVTNSLKAPKTADFPIHTQYTYKQDATDPNVYYVLGYVDAENSFGAMIRSDFTVKIQYLPNTKEYVAKDISIE